MATPLESYPQNLLPANFIPLDGRRYRVQDRDSWVSLYTELRLQSSDGPRSLAFYNFQTFDTNEINWYLRVRVGCKVTHDGLNWAFSASATPGIIYLPPSGTSVVVEPTVITMFPDPSRVKVDKPASKTQLGKMLDVPNHNHMNYISFSLALLDALAAAAEIFVIEVGLAGALGTATGLGTVLTVGLPLLGVVANFMNLGGPYADATDFHVKNRMAVGYGDGVVLGALRKGQDYVRSNYAQLQIDPNLNRSIGPALAAKVRDAYNAALALGYANGLNLNNPQRYRLLWDLHMRLDVSDRDAAAMNRDKWNDRGWELYIDSLSIQFRKHHLKK